MDKKKLGQGPAFPRARGEAGGKYNAGSLGMSKRLYIATKAMQGLLANPNVIQYKHEHPRNDMSPIIAEAAYEFADELLKQENNS